MIKSQDVDWNTGKGGPLGPYGKKLILSRTNPPETKWLQMWCKSQGIQLRLAFPHKIKSHMNEESVFHKKKQILETHSRLLVSKAECGLQSQFWRGKKHMFWVHVLHTWHNPNNPAFHSIISEAPSCGQLVATLPRPLYPAPKVSWVMQLR